MKKLLAILSLFVIIISCSNEEKAEIVPPETDDIIVLSTDFGDMYIVLYDETPKHKENFLKLANEGFYDSTTFHRVMQGFMIQGGDPNSKDDNLGNDGQGGPGYTVEAEFNSKFFHKKGALAAARIGGPQNPEMRSSGSQFYIVHGQPSENLQEDQMNRSAKQSMIRTYVQAPENASILQALQRNQAAGRMDSIQIILDEIEPVATEGFIPRTYTEEQRNIYATLGGAPFLDANYTVYGEVIEGLAIVDSIATTPTMPGDQPVEKVMMKVRVETMTKAEVSEKFGFDYNQ